MKALLALLGLGLLAPMAVADPGGFGSQMTLGDADYHPVTSAASIAVSVNEVELGISGQANDNCLLLDTGTTAAAGAGNNDLRLTACNGKAAGTLIADGDPERIWTYPQVSGENVQYADVNGNAKFDKGDYVYITTQASGLASTSATGTWTVRVTPTANASAGTFVYAGQPDYTIYGANTLALTYTSVVSRGDGARFLLAGTGSSNSGLAAGYPIHSAVPANSIRLTTASATIGVTALKADPTDVVAGRSFLLQLDLKNTGKVPGSGLITTKMAGKTVDTRMSPVLAASQTGSLTFMLQAPTNGTVVEVKADAKSVNITLQPDPLEARVKFLTDRILALESGSAKATAAGQDYEPPKANSPTPAVALVALTILVALALARKHRAGR